ncbi:MAG: ABC transporter ATP-binding protein [Candidatus Eutrophobiaceae bacterium]
MTGSASAEKQNQAVLLIRSLHSHYGQHEALKGINLEVNSGDIAVIIGHSGSGKSTLFRNILGLNTPTSGQIIVLGKELAKLPSKDAFELRKQIGVAFQSGALISALTVRENVALPLEQHTKLDKKTIRIMVRMKLDLMGLLDAQDLMPSELSGGMLKRVGLARAVIMEPKLLFFDEPSSGLDPASAAQLDELMIKLRDTMKISIVVVTHDMESTFQIADKITMLDGGKQIITGTPEDIRASQDVRVLNILQRRFTVRNPQAHSYLDRLTEDTHADRLR